MGQTTPDPALTLKTMSRADWQIDSQKIPVSVFKSQHSSFSSQSLKTYQEGRKP